MSHPLSPALLIASAHALTDARGISAVTGTSAMLVRRYLADVGYAGTDNGPEDGGWSAAFVHHVGYWSHYEYHFKSSVWPLPATASCAELARFAEEKGVLAADHPEVGDVYLLWSRVRKRFVRAGIVVECGKPVLFPSGRIVDQCMTIDGDTNRNGAVRGPHTAVIRRTLNAAGGDRFIRWTMLDCPVNATGLTLTHTIRRVA